MIYCISDIHGRLGPFEDALELVDFTGDNKLVLLGDYIHGGSENIEVLDKIMMLERTYGFEGYVGLTFDDQFIIPAARSIPCSQRRKSPNMPKSTTNRALSATQL